MIKDYFKRCRELNRLRGRKDAPVYVAGAIDPVDDEAIEKLFSLMISVMKNADENDRVRFSNQISELKELLG